MTLVSVLGYISGIEFQPGPNDNLTSGTWTITLTQQSAAVGSVPGAPIGNPLPAQQPQMLGTVSFTTTVKPNLNLGQSLYVAVTS